MNGGMDNLLDKSESFQLLATSARVQSGEKHQARNLDGQSVFDELPVLVAVRTPQAETCGIQVAINQKGLIAPKSEGCQCM
jgi:hypothetical protein